MKKLINNSKKQVLDKLKWVSSLMDVLANILKSFAAIIGSIVAATTAGVTGYYEVKKMIKKEHHVAKAVVSRAPASESLTTTTTEPTSVPETSSYQFDMNSGAFLISIVMLGVLLFNKIRKPKP